MLLSLTTFLKIWGVGEEEEEGKGNKRRENEPIIPKNLRILIAAGLIVGFDHNRKETAGESPREISLMLVNRPGDLNVVKWISIFGPRFWMPLLAIKSVLCLFIRMSQSVILPSEKPASQETARSVLSCRISELTKIIYTFYSPITVDSSIHTSLVPGKI